MSHIADDTNTSPSYQAELLAQQVESIPPLPIIIAHALELTEDDDLSVLSLAHALEADPALTSRLLRVANSAFYGLTQRVYTVRDAIQIIGFEEVRSLALTATVVGGLWVDDELFHRQRFWRHSLRCGLFARIIAIRLRYSKPEVVFTLGVLHDIGRAAMIRNDAEAYRRTVSLMSGEGVVLWKAERRVFGFDHADVGAAMAGKWNLPSSFVSGIRHHHQPNEQDPDFLLGQILALSDSLSHAASPADRGNYITPPLFHGLWDPLGLDEATVRSIFEERDFIEQQTRSLYETAILN
ncbi:MAG: HDOD domain-containing protein [bacterium]|nr:HDOD domain-containing protein [bacterium]